MKLKIKLFLALLSTLLGALGIFSYVVYMEVQEKSLIPLIGHRMDLTSRNASLGVSFKIISNIINSSDPIQTINDQVKSRDFIESTKRITLVKRQNELDKDIEVYGKIALDKQELVLITSSAMNPKLGTNLKIGKYEKQVLTEGLPLFGHKRENNKLIIFGLSPIENKTADIIGLVKTEFDASQILKDSSNDIITILKISALISLLVISVIAWLFGDVLIKQVNTLSKGAKLLAAGDFDVQLPVHSNDELGELTVTFNSMTNTLKDQRDEIKQYSENLEELVKIRTSELNEVNSRLQAMLDNLSQGLFIFNKDQVIQKLYSRAASEILNSGFEKSNIVDLLELGDSEEKWLNMLFEEPLPFVELLPLGPSRKSINNKELDLNFIPLRNENKIDYIMVVVTDITKEIESESKLKEQQKAIARIMHIFENRTSYMSFLSDGKKIIDKIKSFSLNNNDEEKLLFELHTFKGGALLFGHSDLANSIHEAEENLAGGHDSLEVLFEKILKDARKYFGESWKPGEIQATISRSKLINFSAEIEKDKDHAKFIRSFITNTFESELRFLEKSLELTAQRNNKRINPLKITGGDLSLYPEPYRNLISNLVHPINNAVIHGIESSEDRLSKGKRELGNVEISIKESNGSYIINIIDDGKGMDTSQLGSSRDKISIDSGRGVGNYSLENAVLELNGQIDYLDNRPSGLLLEIKVPVISLANKALR